MASAPEKELAKRLECGICLERLEDPRMLRCQHYYCKKCLERVASRNTIECPECRRTTEVPFGDVMNLQSINVLLNNLVPAPAHCQTDVSSSCKKHFGETLKLFCCNELICRDCALRDHKNHSYSYVKEIVPSVKKQILGVLEKARENVRAIESSFKIIKEQEDNLHKQNVEDNRTIDSFIDNQIKHLEERRKMFKNDLKISFTAQKQILDAQKPSFQSSLDRLQSQVKLAEGVLNRGSEVEIMSSKNQLIKQLTKLTSETSELKPRGRIFNKLSLPSNVNLRAVNIREYDEEYELLIRSGKWNYSFGKDLQSDCKEASTFCIRPKSRSSIVNQDNRTQVKIIPPNQHRFSTPHDERKNVEPNVTNSSNGSFSFSYKPLQTGNYEIEVLVNGRYVLGSPFTWKVNDERKSSSLSCPSPSVWFPPY